AAEIDRAIDRTSLSASECARYRGIINATMGRYARALEELDRAESLRALNNNDQSAVGRSICGLRASIRLRLGAADEARQALEQCQAGPDAGPAHIYTLAEAEVHMVQGRLEEATRLAADLRQRLQRGLDNSWMRPWMLSLSLAESSGDAAARAASVNEAAELGEAAPPLAACPAPPTGAHCLATPSPCQSPPRDLVDGVPGRSGHGRAAVRPDPHRVVQDMHSFRSLVPAALAVALAAACAPAGAQDTQADLYIDVATHSMPGMGGLGALGRFAGAMSGGNASYGMARHPGMPGRYMDVALESRIQPGAPAKIGR